MNKSDKEIIKKVLDNASSKDEAANVVGWFATTVEGQNCLSEMIDRDSYLLEGELTETHSITKAQSDSILAKIEKEIQRKALKRNLLRIAAVLLPFVFVISLGFYLTQQVDLFGKTIYSEIYVPKGETMRIFFQDGSEAYLNSDTKLRFPDKFGIKNRKVYLEGEAYFNVSSNKRRPFVVNTGDADIAVLGTSFNVNAYKDENRVQVVLDEGEIVFKTDHNQYEISPGQKIDYDKVIGTTTIYNLKNSSEASLWKENIVHFKDTPLAEVLNTLSRSYDVTFVVENDSVLKYSYTLTTQHTTIDAITEELERIAPVKFNVLGNEIKVFL